MTMPQEMQEHGNDMAITVLSELLRGLEYGDMELESLAQMRGYVETTTPEAAARDFAATGTMTYVVQVRPTNAPKFVQRPVV